MFKDYKKYLSTSVQVYLFLLVIIFIMKLIGLDYFGLDVNNVTLIKINDFILKTHISDLIITFMVSLQFYFYLCIVCKKKYLFKYTFIGVSLNLISQAILVYYSKMDWLYYLCCFSIMMIVPMIANKSIKVKEQIKCLLLMSIYQFICMTIRSIGVNANYDSFLVDWLLSFDQILLLAITYNLVFTEGGMKLCSVQTVGYSLQKKRVFSDLLEKLQKNYSSFKRLNKQEKATIVIYLILSLIWNIFTLVAVFFIAVLNNTLVECIFIVSAFWVSKKAFGKPFHLESMVGCFILSNTTYYVLNRVTTPVGISIILPIMLGVGLSYVTSKFVRKKYFPLYKGMPEEEFENTILQVVKKNSDKYKICYDFFINKENAIFLGRKYNYTEAGIRKITSRVNDKIKALK